MYREQLILIDNSDFRTKIGYYIPVIVAYIVFFCLNKVYGRIVNQSRNFRSNNDKINFTDCFIYSNTTHFPFPKVLIDYFNFCENRQLLIGWLSDVVA